MNGCKADGSSHTAAEVEKDVVRLNRQEMEDFAQIAIGGWLVMNVVRGIKA